MVLLALLLLVVLIALWAISAYNRLIRFKNTVHAAWADVEAHLKRRHDLIPNLVETVKGYMAHERTVLENVTRARAMATSATTPQDLKVAETTLTRALRQLFAVAEKYPDLKANQNFLDLQQSLQEVEQDILQARRYYNAVVRDYNILRQQFPTNLVAQLFGFGPEEYFEIEEAEEAPPTVSFS